MVTVTAASGFDLGYPLQGSADAGERAAGGYYISGAQHGEAPGRWGGKGAASLGLDGEVRHSDYLTLYGAQPANPGTGQQLGRTRRSYEQQYQARLRALLQAEPEATAERRGKIERQARAETRQQAVYTDVTSEFSKSVSILHASLRENIRRAELAGDEDLAAYWRGREERFSEILQQANRAGMEWLQEHAGVTRTGHHGRGGDGRWEDAELVVSSWLQGTSRAGDVHDHVHNVVLPLVRTVRDGKWRAPDTMAIRHQLPAVQAVIAAHSEAALSAEFGVEWVPRADGAGNEIRGISEAEIDAYSTRRNEVNTRLAEIAADFSREYGREPNQRELLILHHEAWAVTRPRKEEKQLLTDGEIDWAKAAEMWDAKLGGKLAQVAGRVTGKPRRSGPAADEAVLARAARQALAAVQAKHPAWTRADLMRQCGAAIPAECKGTDPAAAVELVCVLTDRVLAGEFEPVEELEPEPREPGFYRPGTERYSTRTQITLEERLLEDAAAQCAPVHAREIDAGGLRDDQAEALSHVLSSPSVATVLVGPAGSGKTRVLAAAARSWDGPVIGLTTSQAARNVLAEAGVEVAENTAQFLGHLPGERGALGARRPEPGTLILIDEASMMSTADMADITAIARRSGCRMIVAGDHAQLGAVEGGGAMKLMKGRLGCVQLTEAVRFGHQWEREAGLRLRRGEHDALHEYDVRGRITGGDPEECLERAAREYVGHYTAGDDVLLIALSHATGDELSRRVRGELVHLGLVDDSRTVPLMRGARCGAGDLITATVNDHAAGVANGDSMRVESVLDDGSIMARRGDGEAFRFTGTATAQLGYARTGQTSQGRTVGTCLAVVTGAESREWVYTVMTRGADMNRVFVHTRSPRRPDLRTGTAPAPELARQRGLDRARSAAEAMRPQGPAEAARDPRDVLADALGNPLAQESALDARDRRSSDRYRALTAAVVPEGMHADLDSSRAAWLWRALRDAESAGLDAADVIAQAVRHAPLAGSRNVAAVLHARVGKVVAGQRQETGTEGMTDGQLWLSRSRYEAATCWAPEYPGEELRHASLARLECAADARWSAAQAQAARKRGDESLAIRHERIAADASRNAGILSRLIDRDEGLLADYRDWAARTAERRQEAAEADRELRRRGERIAPLESAEPRAEGAAPALTEEAVSERIAQREASRARYARALEERSGEWPVPERDRDPVLIPPEPQPMPVSHCRQAEAHSDREAGE